MLGLLIEVDEEVVESTEPAAVFVVGLDELLNLSDRQGSSKIAQLYNSIVSVREHFIEHSGGFPISSHGASIE